MTCKNTNYTSFWDVEFHFFSEKFLNAENDCCRLSSNNKFVFSVSSQQELPSFSWEKANARQFYPLLRIAFPDGSEDYAVLNAFNPIPLGRDEREEDVDNCIYDGHLLNEKDVYVTMAGCADSNTFQVNLINFLVYHQAII